MSQQQGSIVANKEDALKCLLLSRDLNISKELSIKYVEKSLRLYWTLEAENRLKELCNDNNVDACKNEESNSSTTEQPKTSSTSTKATNNPPPKATATTSATNDTATNDHQLKKVKEMLKIDSNDFYGILFLKRSETPSDADIKKSYRKLALQFHPDKCRVNGADEVFKRVGRAFACLSDPQKRRQYDQFGSSTSHHSHTHSHSPFNRGGTSFESDISPEDLFNMFFQQAGGMHNHSFTSTGSPLGDLFMNAMNNQINQQNRRRNTRPPHHSNDDSNANILLQILPIIFMVLFSLFGGIFSFNSNNHNESGRAPSQAKLSIIQSIENPTHFSDISPFVTLDPKGNSDANKNGNEYPHRFRTGRKQIPYRSTKEFSHYFSGNNLSNFRKKKLQLSAWEDLIEKEKNDSNK